MPARKAKPAEDLQSTIRAKGFDWTAGPTSVSVLSPAERKAHLGLRVTKEELQATARAITAEEALRALQGAISAPSAADWRNNNGNWITPIKDQSSCGSCVSFATVATLESRIRIACANAALSLDLSEAHLFYCGCGNCCDTGWNFPPALDFCKNTGIALESAFPYTPGNQSCKPGLTSYVKITNWTSVLSVADRKNTLAAKGPMVAGLAIYSDFYSYRSGIYRRTSNTLEGYHAVSVVGYDDQQQCWICKNSWGLGWGDAGFFKIGYGEADMDTQFAFYDIEVKCPAPPVSDCERYVPSLRRVIEVARVNASLRFCLRYYVCGRGRRPLCPASHLNVVRAVLQVLQRCPQYRGPFCRALG
jgi:C1A family cysteine protease